MLSYIFAKIANFLFHNYLISEVKRLMADLELQLAELQVAFTDQVAALTEELEEVKDKVAIIRTFIDELKANNEALAAKLATYESIDLTEQIDAVKASIAKIESVSDLVFDPNPVVEPEPEPEI
jgi:phage host-nuclease inhibitor protein Gam